MSFLIALFVAILVICLIWWGLNTLAAAFGLPPQIVAVVQVLLVILVVVWLISNLGGFPHLSVR